ncbi:Retrotrans gag domain-containing protein [Abeliophyllum distichum]|uniref:Retrotrans gag domain-containing protein n=1 Tax=Abeliophyllum distichum TaxID=126358 RepID=A0ABD1UN77_9LAMI
MMANKQARVVVAEATPLATQQIQHHGIVEIDKGDFLVSQFFTPVADLERSNIVCPNFRQSDFQLRADLINLFSNNLQFYGNTNENPNTHISRFIRMCQNFEFQKVRDDGIKLRLFLYTLKDGALEWLDSEPHAIITHLG